MWFHRLVQDHKSGCLYWSHWWQGQKQNLYVVKGNKSGPRFTFKTECQKFKFTPMCQQITFISYSWRSQYNVHFHMYAWCYIACTVFVHCGTHQNRLTNHNKVQFIDMNMYLFFFSCFSYPVDRIHHKKSTLFSLYILFSLQTREQVYSVCCSLVVSDGGNSSSIHGQWTAWVDMFPSRCRWMLPV